MASARPDSAPEPLPGRDCQSVEWYSEGQFRIVELNGIRVTIRFVGRRGRRARIAITAPSGAVFCAGGTETMNDSRSYPNSR